jgi:hypothetical protein
MKNVKLRRTGEESLFYLGWSFPPNLAIVKDLQDSKANVQRVGNAENGVENPKGINVIH